MDNITELQKSLITGLILAGGRATRMQELDKGLQIFRDATLIEHVIKRFAPQVNSLIINANRNQPSYSELGYPVVSDVRADYAGPLAGLEAGLLACETPFLLTVPCDSPFLPLNLASKLMRELERTNADLAMACSGNSAQPSLQPVFCLMKTMHLNRLQAYLNGGGRKMSGWFDGLTMTPVYFENETEFTNLNTLDELGLYSP